MVNFYLLLFLIFIKFLYSRSFSKYLFPYKFIRKFRIHSYGNGITLNMINHTTQKEKNSPFFDLVETLDRFNTSSYKINDLIIQITNIGWVSTNDIILFSKDFTSRPEVLTDILQKDFSFKAIDAHLLRSALFSLINEKNKNTDKSMTSSSLHNSLTTNNKDDNKSNNEKGNYKQLKLIPRKFLSKDKIYGILNNTDLFPLLSYELNEFFIFMTEPNVQSSDPPVRKATAEVYMRMVHQFCGWIYNTKCSTDREALEFRYSSSSMSPVEKVSFRDFRLLHIFPNKDKTSATIIFEFLKWLRNERKISLSYEANILRGLIKLTKFRFANESNSDVMYGSKAFDDVPLVRELRKLHREANKLSNKSPRVSDESLKWLSWNEYLSVVQELKKELQEMIEYYNSINATEKNSEILEYKKKVANKYQEYLLLAFLSYIPDRQRTFRELIIGKNFLKSSSLIQGVKDVSWVIKHGPNDYKTGKNYGDRPPLVLPSYMTPVIDDYITNWRPALSQSNDYFFLQKHKGNPITQDGIHKLVSQACFRKTGKKTNPHLLRDIIVTHVRTTNASEKQLEALALYMGHSIQMQRTSYDRRTLNQKVEPAVSLLESISDLNNFS